MRALFLDFPTGTCYDADVSGRLARTGAPPVRVAPDESTSAPSVALCSEGASPSGLQLPAACVWCAHKTCPDKGILPGRTPTRGKTRAGDSVCVGCPACRELRTSRVAP